MRKIIIVWMCLLLVGCSQETVITESTQPLSDYYMVDEYALINPNEVQLIETFNNYVQNPIDNNFDVDNVETLNVAIIYPGEQVSDYWRRSVKSFTKRMDEHNLPYTIQEYFTTANESVAVQEEQIRLALASNPDYLIFTLDAKSHMKIIEQIIDQNQTKVILQNITTPIRSWGVSQPFMYVGFDHKIGSELMADEYIKRFESRTNYGVLYFTEGYVSEMRGDTFIDYLDEHSDFEMVASYYTDGDRVKSKNAAIDMLENHPDLKFIYACSTDVALGALDATKELGLESTIAVNGWGGGSAELEKMLNKEMYMTVMRMNDDNGVAMAEAIYMDATGRQDYIPTIFSGEFKLIDQSTSKAELDALIKRAFRYSD